MLILANLFWSKKLFFFQKMFSIMNSFIIIYNNCLVLYKFRCLSNLSIMASNNSFNGLLIEDDEYNTSFCSSPTIQTELKSRFTDLGLLVPGIINKLRQEAEKLFPNPPGTEYPSKLRISFRSGIGYRATAYAASVEEADAILKDFLQQAKVYVANYDTYVFVGNALPENIDNFFSKSDTRRLGPYTFTLVERADGLFIKMTRLAVNLRYFYDAHAEFLGIGNFLHLLNGPASTLVHIQNELRQMSPEIDAAVKKNYTTGSTTPSIKLGLPRPTTLNDFFHNLEIDNGKSQKAKKADTVHIKL
jgi:hypothetical protein